MTVLGDDYAEVSVEAIWMSSTFFPDIAALEGMWQTEWVKTRIAHPPCHITSPPWYPLAQERWQGILRPFATGSKTPRVRGYSLADVLSPLPNASWIKGFKERGF